MSVMIILQRTLALLGFVFVLSALPSDTHAQALTLGCTTSISTFAFPSVDVLGGTAVSTNGTLKFSCASLTGITSDIYICVTIPPRAMIGTSTGATLAYDLFGPSSSTTSWSNTTPIRVPFGTLQVGQSFSLNIPATVFGSQQTVPADNYSQTISATVSASTQNNCSGNGGSAQTSFQVTATVIKNCDIAANNLTFPSVTSLASSTNGQTALSVICTKGTSYTLALNEGNSGATSPTLRKMTSGSNSITYGLYQNSSCLLPWGWTTATEVSGTGTATSQSITVYGCVPAQTTPPPGTYSDTIVATVTY